MISLRKHFPFNPVAPPPTAFLGWGACPCVCSGAPGCLPALLGWGVFAAKVLMGPVTPPTPFNFAVGSTACGLDQVWSGPQNLSMSVHQQAHKLPWDHRVLRGDGTLGRKWGPPAAFAGGLPAPRLAPAVARGLWRGMWRGCQAARARRAGPAGDIPPCAGTGPDGHLQLQPHPDGPALLCSSEACWHLGTGLASRPRKPNFPPSGRRDDRGSGHGGGEHLPISQASGGGSGLEGSVQLRSKQSLASSRD